MTAPEPLAEVALAFAREVMGDEPAEAQRSLDWRAMQVYREPVVENGIVKRPGLALVYTDLNAVVAEVARWCRHRTSQRQSYGFALTYGGMKKKYHASIKRGATRWHHTSDDPCHALMSACLAAARKVKGAA